MKKEFKFYGQLTNSQQAYFDSFLGYVNKRKNLFFSSKQRGIGKTHIINELGFTLQSLGYKVFVFSPHNTILSYYTNGFVSLIDYERTMLGKDKTKTVVLVDEARKDTMVGLVDYFNFHKIPVVGFVIYTSSSKYNTGESFSDIDKNIEKSFTSTDKSVDDALEERYLAERFLMEDDFIRGGKTNDLRNVGYTF